MEQGEVLQYGIIRFVFKKYFNVLLVDLRGHGKSKASPDGTEYTFDKLINDLVEVLDHNRIKKSFCWYFAWQYINTKNAFFT